ncbi:MAG: hypothetical protein Q4A82_03415 [Corynebacterium sp.]|nr:hypothetical protein [Corynebacterium sp.]
MHGGVIQAVFVLQQGFCVAGSGVFGGDPGVPVGPVLAVEGLDEGLAVGKLIQPGGFDIGAGRQG